LFSWSRRFIVCLLFCFSFASFVSLTAKLF
jgi:hypothetical protein